MASQENEILSWTEIKTRYPNEWVFIGNPIFDGLQLLEGVVITHHSDKRVASMEGGELRVGFQKFSLQYTGQTHSRKHIGLLRKLNITS
jgi:hypothetical protein